MLNFFPRSPPKSSLEFLRACIPNSVSVLILFYQGPLLVHVLVSAAMVISGMSLFINQLNCFVFALWLQCHDDDGLHRLLSRSAG